MTNKPNYYAILPAKIRYDKSITTNAKLLFAEITALANKEGYCWANNTYFAKLYDVNKRTVQRWLQSLEDYIEIEVNEYGNNRKITLRGDTQCHGGVAKMSWGGGKNVTHNNKYNNNITLLSKDNKGDVPSLSKKPCDKYNYKYPDLESSEYMAKLSQTKNSYIMMLKRDYGQFLLATRKENLLSERNQKYFRALTTFLLEWNKEHPNKVSTFRDLVKTYYRNIFVEAEKGTVHEYYRNEPPQPTQVLTDNSITLWNNFWIDNPMLKIKSKEVSLEMKVQQGKEKKKFEWYLEELHEHIMEKGHDLVLNNNKAFWDLKDLKKRIEKYREECLNEKEKTTKEN